MFFRKTFRLNPHNFMEMLHITFKSTYSIYQVLLLTTLCKLFRGLLQISVPMVNISDYEWQLFPHRNLSN